MLNDAPAALRSSMLTHLSETMVDAEKFSWESVLRFQTTVFHGIEAGKITFKDLDVINLWRLRHDFDPIGTPEESDTDEELDYFRSPVSPEPCLGT